MLSAHGVPFVAACLARGAEEAWWRPDELGFPVALKAMGLQHKSDEGGVVLDLADPPALAPRASMRRTARRDRALGGADGDS